MSKHSTFTDRDEYFMRQALRLAKRGMGWTNPNPMVGAVIVKDDKIISHGYHKKIAYPHAEVNAIDSVSDPLSGSKIYLNLEPCSHVGKTPPCTEAVIKAGISHVICSIQDPNPLVAGEGIRQLRRAGVKVDVGLLKEEASKLNEAFITSHTKKRPFIAVKFAASLDGKIATKTGDSKWISGERSRLLARGLRGKYQAILVGINTVLKDDPHLGVRIKGKKDPIRIILDSALKIPLSAQVLRDKNVIIATTKNASQRKMSKLKSKQTDILTFDGPLVPLDKLMNELTKRQIISVLVEGGGSTIGSFVDERLIDKVYAFHAPLLVGGHDATSAAQGSGVSTISEAIRLKDVRYKKLGDDMLTIGYT